MSPPLTLLVDNGSLEPASILALRGVAAKLSQRIGQPVQPVSLLHSSGVPADKIGGVAAEILEPALERRLGIGLEDFLILPLFFGPSGALTDYLPARLAHLRGKHRHLNVAMAAPLYQPTDERLARILADHVRSVAGPARRVALVDHGSPAQVVIDVRNALAGQLASLLARDFIVAAASMERREGPAYDFCEPLLAGLLRSRGWNSGDIVVAMQFLLPGRHAGPHGDVAAICNAAREASGGALRTVMTPLVAEHPLLIDILADRWKAAGGGR
jgi:hypothetical protein